MSYIEVEVNVDEDSIEELIKDAVEEQMPSMQDIASEVEYSDLAEHIDVSDIADYVRTDLGDRLDEVEEFNSTHSRDYTDMVKMIDDHKLFVVEQVGKLVRDIHALRHPFTPPSLYRRFLRWCNTHLPFLRK